MLHTVVRIVGWATVAVGVLLTSGATYEQIKLMGDTERYPAPGKLTEIGSGRHLHIICEGNSPSPTVVMETGAGDGSYRFWDIQHRIAAFAHVCVYDRAGLGWSDPAPEPRSLEERANDLHTLLIRANILPPYVLAAHSMGGLIVRLYARDHRDEVRGLVLIDVSEEGLNYGQLAAEINPQTERFEGVLREAEWAARFGLLPLFQKFHPELSSPTGLPENAVAMFSRPGTFRAARYDLIDMTQRVPPAMQKPGGFGGLLGDDPIIVISHGVFPRTALKGMRQAILDSADRLAALSNDSVKIIARKSGHYVYVSEPDLVVDAVRRVYTAARDGTKLTHIEKAEDLPEH